MCLSIILSLSLLCSCDVCWDEKVADEDEVTQDLIQAFDPLAESNNSDTLVSKYFIGLPVAYLRTVLYHRLNVLYV